MQGNPQETSLAYIAGIIDGEGTMVIGKTFTENVKKNSKIINPRFSANIAVAMTREEPCLFIYNTTKLGNEWQMSVRKGRENHKQFYIWRVDNRNEIVSFVKLIRKYLLIKTKQADLLVDFCSNWKTPFDRQKGIDLDELQRREDAYQEMRKLNRVGVLATTESPRAEKPSDSLNS